MELKIRVFGSDSKGFEVPATAVIGVTGVDGGSSEVTTAEGTYRCACAASEVLAIVAAIPPAPSA